MIKYKPGDKVIVLPYEEIQAKFVTADKLPSTVRFTRGMENFCGGEYEIIYAEEYHGVGCYWFADNGCWFTDEMLEDTQDVPFDGALMNFDSLFA